MNRYEGRGPATRFGTPDDRERRDPRLGATQGMRGDQEHGGNWGGPTQGDYRGGYPSNGPDRGWGAGPSWARDDHDGGRGEGAELRSQQDRHESYRDREGRFGTTYGMSRDQPQAHEADRFPSRDDGRGTYEHGSFRDAEPSYGYQDNEGWGGRGRGLSEVRGAPSHDRYDPRYSRQDARHFGGQQRFGQGWESDQFQSRARSSNTVSPSNHSGAFGGASRGGWDRDDRFDSRNDPRFQVGLGSFEHGSGDVSRGSAGFAGRHGPGQMGRGPKGYQRSDERIREEICELLSRQGRIDASEVEVKVSGGEVILTGTVMQRGDKLDIEHLVEHVSGVKDVRNEIRRAPLTSGQSAHTGNVSGAQAVSPGGSSPTNKGETGNKSPSTRHSS